MEIRAPIVKALKLWTTQRNLREGGSVHAGGGGGGGGGERGGGGGGSMHAGGAASWPGLALVSQL